ncbi:hypothetical protein AHF37_09430 [Paragonimus kellicotti]|nr:hypothetical protein AHF37_09430 [Paragonimus kellicotti]
MRQGLGVRRSAPYALASEFSRTVRAAQSQNSIPSGTDSERGWRGTGSIGGGSGGDVRSGAERGRSDERRSGFVLRSVSCPASSSQSRGTSSGYHGSSLGTEKKSIFKRGLFRKLRKQKSTGDLSVVGAQTLGGYSSGCGGGSLFHGRSRRAGGSLRSTLSGSSQLTTNSFGRGDLKALGNGGQGVQEIIDEPLGPNVTETYSGEWNEDRRSGYGVAERSDGLKYVGEWFNNKKDGYGVTYHADGTKEEGKYKENILVQPLNRRSKLFLIRHTKLRDAVEEAVKNAQDMSKKAQGNATESAYQSIGGGSGGDVRSGAERGRSDERRSGFVLRSVSCPASSSQSRGTSSGYHGSSLGTEKKSIFKRGLFRKLRKQKSTGDLSVVGAQTLGGYSSGCGGGSLFHGRSRRAGGSLRSTLSGSSQLTTNSFGRGDLKALGNGGQGVQEIIDEPLGPNVTETYSGEWNEDRRSGYGVAERSDGLKRSKLFLIRHTKLRDAVEEAVKNAQDMSKKAQGNATESAYQR